MASYCTVDQWAVKKNYDDFTAYNKEYPTEATLQSMLDEMTGLMNDEMGNFTGSNVSDSQYLETLKNICYRGVELMIDEEEGRSGGFNTMQYAPKDYMYERDRKRLQTIGARKGFLVVGDVG